MVQQVENPRILPSALSIAGLDPSGGAGIAMDLKTFAACGVWGQAVVTALTAQNSLTVTRSVPVPANLIREQIAVLLQDITPLAIKTGMLASADIISAVAEALPRPIPLVVDPVLAATTGYSLTRSDAVPVLVEELIPLATVVTPNIPEAEIITRQYHLCTRGDIIQAGRSILDMGPCAVLMTGGHGDGPESVDILITRDDVSFLSAPRAPYDVHGSGCCLSAAITAFLAEGMDLFPACRKAKELLSTAIEQATPGLLGRYILHPGPVS
ncbi:MAG: bifunctional hydroxymethylpyrimidine kinase/phosphomethylpyrimidine kinase [Methanospirillaceae archaeon]|nr:bifunctional hydroxymethylpyrimidine kinase/phosphomethylpyrimidine kinase [Methanospirillaceae archaeon]